MDTRLKTTQEARNRLVEELEKQGQSAALDLLWMWIRQGCIKREQFKEILEELMPVFSYR